MLCCQLRQKEVEKWAAILCMYHCPLGVKAQATSCFSSEDCCMGAKSLLFDMKRLHWLQDHSATTEDLHV